MDDTGRGSDTLRVYKPQEALERQCADLVVDDGAEVELVASRSSSQEYFARVQVRSVSDLQVLGLVPRGIPEEKIRQAVIADDKSAYDAARETLSSASMHPCACEASAGNSHRPYSTTFARAYSGIRKSHNPALANLLSDFQKTRLRWDSIHVQSVKGWLDRIERVAFDVPTLISLFQDIRIGRNSRLVLDPDAVNLYARGIYIHRTGSLIHRGGYLRIWASQITSYLDWTPSMVVKAEVPWRVAH